MEEVKKLNFDPSLVEYGYPEEWKKFAGRHPEFTKRFSNFANAIDIVFGRIHETTSQAEKLIYFLGRTAVEDFMEILLWQWVWNRCSEALTGAIRADRDGQIHFQTSR